MPTWILENDVFNQADPLREGAKQHGHKVLTWSDDWWPKLPVMTTPAMFHGSLANAHQIAQSGQWRPGAWCDTARFHCSAWYPHAEPWLVHRTWRSFTAVDFVRRQEQILAEMGDPDRIFVRPDSPLKPFSGRVLTRDTISLKALDYGFYFDDETLPVIVAPIRTIGREWRFVVVADQVVTGSEYLAEGRRARASQVPPEVWRLAETVTAALPAPETVYVLDLCEANGDYCVMELNPFSGADLYACDGAALVAAISPLLHLANDQP